MRAKWLPYDTIKLIVLFILAVLLIWLDPCATLTGILRGKSVAQNDNNLTAINPATQPVHPETSEVGVGETQAATAVPTTMPVLPPTSATSVTDDAQTNASMPVCQKALTPRLDISNPDVVVVNVRELPLRSSPMVGAGNILRMMPAGIHLEILGVPVCTEYLSGANYWWPVRTTDGLTGYAAEGSAIRDVYYLETVN